MAQTGRETNSQLVDTPAKLSANWGGYLHYKHKTLLPSNVLTFPTRNCFIPINDKVVPRLGSSSLGTLAENIAYEVTYPIDGRYKKFSSKSGQIVEIRTYIASVAETPLTLFRTYEFLYTNETTGEQTWVTFFNSVVDTLPSNIPGGKRVYFTEWSDIEQHKNRLVWVDGTNIREWSGGIGVITNITGNDVTIDGTSWGALGFDDGTIYANGVSHTITSWNGGTSATITLNNVTGMAVGDVVVGGVLSRSVSGATNNEVTAFHYVKTIKNHVVYGNFSSPILFGANSNNIESSALKTSFNGAQDDLIITDGDQYTGTARTTIKLSIVDVVEPPLRIYAPGDGETIGDNLVFSGTHTGTTRDKYVIVVATPGPIQTVNIFINGVSFATGVVTSTITPANPYTLTNGMSFYFIQAAGPVQVHAVNTGWELNVGGVDQYSVYINNSDTPTVTNDADTPYVYNGVTFSFSSPDGHTLGDTWDILLEPAVTQAWWDFYQSSPVRRPYQAFTIFLAANFWTMDIQEDTLYINDQWGRWGYLTFQLSADLLSETVLLTPLKYTTALRVLYPYSIGQMEDYLVFITSEKKLQMIGRKKFLQLPQSEYLSDPVDLDFQRCSFKGGSIEYWAKKLWLSSPDQGIMLCYDNVRKYWQPPQEIPTTGILSVVLEAIEPEASGLSPFTGIDRLIAHSSTQSGTNTLFKGKNDNGHAFTLQIRTGYLSYGNRWQSKIANMTFIEGGMNGNPSITLSLICGMEGCEGGNTHTVVPVLCVPPGDPSLGKSVFGAHPFGNDNALSEMPYFREIYPFQPLGFYFAAIDLLCESLDQDWYLISVGTNAVNGPSGNDELQNQEGVNFETGEVLDENLLGGML